MLILMLMIMFYEVALLLMLMITIMLMIILFGEKHQRDKPNNKECLSNNISVNINEDLQSWLNDDNIITEATLPENFRCIISGPTTECGKTFLLKKNFFKKI